MHGQQNIKTIFTVFIVAPSIL